MRPARVSLPLFFLAFLCGLAIGCAILTTTHVQLLEGRIARLSALIAQP